MSVGAPRARVTLRSRRLSFVRASLGLTRWVLYAVALAGVIATVRDAIAPARRLLLVAAAPPTNDANAEWFALSFARAYLTWSADPSTREAALSRFLTADADPDAGFTPASGSSEQVRWVAIARATVGVAGERDYTVAAGTGGDAVRYLVVSVGRRDDGTEVLLHYPALVAGPTAGQAAQLDGSGLLPVTSAAVVAVLDRALRNYVDSSAQNLAADLAPGALVDPVAGGLSMRSVLRLAVETSGGVLASVLARDPTGDLFTLAYELRLRQVLGRWEITRIEQ
jgi:hypothetical protein